MAIVYELTFFLGLGLLATVVTIYVLSVTQIGKSTELSSEKQKNIITEQKNSAAKQIERLQKQLDDARKAGRLDESTLKRELLESHAEIETYETELKHIKERTLLLERTGAVVWPGSSFLATIVFSVAAVATIGINNIMPLSFWIIGIFTLIFGIHRVYRTLGAIQETTITSRDAIDKLPEAVKSALLDIELSRKPELVVAFVDEQPPLHLASEQECSINLRVSLSKGEIARDISVFFACPPEFTFTSLHPCAPPSNELYKNYISVVLNTNSLTYGVNMIYRFRLKTPATPGDYNLIYMISCEGFVMPWTPFQVIVE